MNRGLLAGVVIGVLAIGIGAVIWFNWGPTRTPTTASVETAPLPAEPTSQPTTPVPTTPATPSVPPAAPAAKPPAPEPQQQAVLPPPVPPRPVVAGPSPTTDDRILGQPNAPITIFEFASLTCPHCADFDANTLPKLKAEWIDTGKARLIFRDFPLDQAAVRAATLARCAPPEQFYAFVDALFRGQTNWAVSGKIDTALGKLAKVAGMSDETYAACMKDEAAQKQVLNSRLEAEQQYKVESTPTFFINGTRLEGAQPYSQFEKVLNQAASQP